MRRSVIETAVHDVREVFYCAAFFERPALKVVAVSIKGDEGELCLCAVDEFFGFHLVGGAVRIVGYEGYRVCSLIEIVSENIFRCVIGDNELSYAVCLFDLGISFYCMFGFEVFTDVCVTVNGFGRFIVAGECSVLKEDLNGVFDLVFCDKGYVSLAHNGVGSELLTVKSPHSEDGAFLFGGKRCDLVK